MGKSPKDPEYILSVLVNQFGYSTEEAEPQVEVLLDLANAGTFKSCRDLKEYICYYL